MSHRLYQVAVRHAQLNAYRIISGTDWYTVNMKARVQYEAWEAEWRARVAQQEAQRQQAERRDRRERASRDKRDSEIRRCQAWASAQSAEARAAILAIERLLQHALSVDNAVDWEGLVDRSEFTKPRPVPARVEPPPDVPSPGDAPDANSPRYQPDLGLLGHVSSGRRAAAIAEAAARLEMDRSKWAAAVTAAREARAISEARHEAAKHEAERVFAKTIEEWDRERSEFLERRAERNATLAERRRRYEERDASAVVEYCHMVLARSEYPDSFPRDVVIDFIAETGSLVVDVTLPAVDVLPEVSSVAYDADSSAFTVVKLSPSERTRLHESVLYQIPLRTAHELFTADRAGVLDSVAINGWIRGSETVDPESRCVISLVVDRPTFDALDLDRVDPKQCFKTLGGIGWSEQYNLDPVAPIVEARPETVESGSARPTASMYGGLGIEEMSIADFEHLTRELVESDIAGSDEQVSLARVAGGVDAIVLTASPRRRVRVLVHARRGEGGCSLDALRSLRDSATYERADEALFIATEEADSRVRDLASSLGIALVDGPRLINLLARHAGRVSIDMRSTGPIRGSTQELDASDRVS